MKYIFRVDGNSQIGIGHIMRCLTIAEALSGIIGIENICFITSDDISGKVVNEHGFFVYVLHTAYNEMEEEIPKWESLNISDAVILVDSYYVTDVYLRELKKYGKILLLDDFQEHKYPVDVVINYNVYGNQDRYIELYGDESKFYIGRNYVPIRKQFLECNYKVGCDIKNVMITTGGGDIYNIAKDIYIELSSVKKDVIYHIISGAFNPHFLELKKMELKNKNLIVYHDVSNMSEIMKNVMWLLQLGGVLYMNWLL